MVHMPDWPKKIIKHPDIKDLSRMLSIMGKLGNPHLKAPPTIHIAGTNGKGSTCAILKSILTNSGYYTHVYTSPHILHFNERIVISNEIISDNLLHRYLEEVRTACEAIDFEPTFFEATTAAAFLAFSEHKADFLILETGMGGRLDPTNIIPRPMATIITPVSYDHMEYLGHEIGLIAREKAGIIKEGVPCIISRQDDKVMDILLETCEAKSCPAIAYEYDFMVEPKVEGFYFQSRMGNIDIPKLGLDGHHQIINSGAALAFIFLIKKTYLNITNESIITALARTYWRGRIEEVKIAKMLPEKNNLRCFVDGAHNVSGAASLAEWISSKGFKDIVIIVGLTKNRDVGAFLSQFEHLNAKIYSVPVLSEPLSYSSENLANSAKNFGIEVEPTYSLQDALELAAKTDNDRAIIITGSLFLVSDFYKLKAQYY